MCFYLMITDCNLYSKKTNLCIGKKEHIYKWLPTETRPARHLFYHRVTATYKFYFLSLSLVHVWHHEQTSVPRDVTRYDRVFMSFTCSYICRPFFCLPSLILHRWNTPFIHINESGVRRCVMTSLFIPRSFFKLNTWNRKTSWSPQYNVKYI